MVKVEVVVEIRADNVKKQNTESKGIPLSQSLGSGLPRGDTVGNKYITVGDCQTATIKVQRVASVVSSPSIGRPLSGRMQAVFPGQWCASWSRRRKSKVILWGPASWPCPRMAPGWRRWAGTAC